MEAPRTFRTRLEALASGTLPTHIATAATAYGVTVGSPRVTRVTPTPRDFFPQVEITLPVGEVEAFPARTNTTMECTVFFHDSGSSRDELDNRMQAALDGLCETYRYVEYDGGNTVVELVAFDAYPLERITDTSLLQSVSVTVRCMTAEDD